MENQRTQMKVAMQYGAFFGLCGIASFLLFYFISMDLQSKLPSMVSYALLITFIVLGIKSYRDQDLGGFIGYGKALGTGTLIALFGGIVTGIFSFIFFSYIAPDMADRIIEAAQQKMMEQGNTEEQIEMATTWTRKLMTPPWILVLSIIGNTIMGLIFSLIISIFLRKEQNPFNSNVG